MRAQADCPCLPSQTAHPCARAELLSREILPAQDRYSSHSKAISTLQPCARVTVYSGQKGYLNGAYVEKQHRRKEQLGRTTVIGFYQQTFTTAFGNEWPSREQPGGVLRTQCSRGCIPSELNSKTSSICLWRARERETLPPIATCLLHKQAAAWGTLLPALRCGYHKLKRPPYTRQQLMATLVGTLSFYCQSEFGQTGCLHYRRAVRGIDTLIKGVQVRWLGHFKFTPHFVFCRPFSEQISLMVSWLLFRNTQACLTGAICFQTGEDSLASGHIWMFLCSHMEEK